MTPREHEVWCASNVGWCYGSRPRCDCGKHGRVVGAVIAWFWDWGSTVVFILGTALVVVATVLSLAGCAHGESPRVHEHTPENCRTVCEAWKPAPTVQYGGRECDCVELRRKP